PHALAGALVAAGIPDMPMVVTTRGTRGEMRYRSVYAMAGHTIKETATTPARRVKWSAYEEGPASRVPQGADTSGRKQGPDLAPGKTAADGSWGAENAY